MGRSKAPGKQCLDYNYTLTYCVNLVWAYHMMDSADHQLSRVTGFLPEQEPLSRLPDYYVIWEETLDNLNSLIKSKKLRVHVDRWQLLQLSSSSFTSERHWQRAYVVLTFIGQAYIWMHGVEDTPTRLPEVLARPWWEVSEYLGMPPRE